MNKGELTGLFLIGLGGSGVLFIVVYKLSFLIPALIAQNGRLATLGFFSFVMVVVGGFVLNAAN